MEAATKILQGLYQGYSELVANACGPLLKHLLQPSLDSEGQVDRVNLGLKTAVVAGCGFLAWHTPLYIAARFLRFWESRVVTPLIGRFVGSSAVSAIHKICWLMTHRYLLCTASTALAGSWAFVFYNGALQGSQRESEALRIATSILFLGEILKQDNWQQTLLNSTAAIAYLDNTEERNKYPVVVQALRDKQSELIQFILTPGADEQKMDLLQALVTATLIQKNGVSEPDVCALFDCVHNDAVGRALINAGFAIHSQNAEGQTALAIALNGWLEASSTEKMEKVCRLISLGGKVDLYVGVEIGEESRTYTEWLAYLSPTLLHTLARPKDFRNSQGETFETTPFPSKEQMIAWIEENKKLPASDYKNLDIVKQTLQGLSLWEVILQQEKKVSDNLAAAFLDKLTPNQRFYYLHLTLASGRIEYLPSFNEVELKWFECLTCFKCVQTAATFVKKFVNENVKADIDTWLNKDDLSPLAYLAQKKPNDPLFKEFSKYNYIKFLLDEGLQRFNDSNRESILTALDKEADKNLITYLNGRKS